MNRCLRAFAWMLMLHAVFPMAADATAGMGRYRVRFAEHVIDTGQAASQVLAICRCRQEPYAELGFTGIVVVASPAGANLLSRDPRVAAVEELTDVEDAATMPAAPPVTAAVTPPSTVISAPVGPDAHSKFEVLGPYEYDGSGNIRKIGSSVFVYDAYGRVVSGQAAGRTQTYTYDRYGNQVSKTTDGSRSDFRADGATNRMNGATYDGAGRLRSYPGLGTYTFDSLDTLTASTVGAGPAVYVYNASDERIVTYQVDAYGRELSSEWTLRDASGAVLRRFLKSADGKWSWDEDYVYLDGRMLAAETAGPHRTLHFHLDHLGTPRLITNHTGAVVSEHAYFPFGEEASSTTQNTEKKKFTGHERDNVGQDYMHARYYTGYWGRFLSVDPTWESADLSRPQSWNRYSYVLNNPINLTDPDGKCGICWDVLSGDTPLFEKGYDPEVSDNPPRTKEEFEQRVSEGRAARTDGPVVPVVMGTRTTPPTLPDKTLATDGKVKIEHNYKSNDHPPAHAHVKGGGPDTRIGPNGQPAMKGDAPMTAAQRKVYDANKSQVRRAINKIGRWLDWISKVR